MTDPSAPETFETDPRLLANSLNVASLALCDVRLMDEARFAWLVLIPRRAGATELDDLNAADRAQLMIEMIRAGEAVRAVGIAQGRPVDKLNSAALGNVTAQLHIHVVGRRHDDPLWPDPVWGRPGAKPLSPDVLAQLAKVALASLLQT